MIKHNREKFLELLTLVKPSLGNFDKVEELGCFRFENDKIRTFDGVVETMKEYPVGLDCCVPASRLYEWFLDEKKISTVLISLENNGNVLRLSDPDGELVTNLNTIDKDDYPPIRIFGQEWFPLDDSFKEALEISKFSASEDPSMSYLCGTYITKDFMLTSDSWRLTKCEVNVPGPTPFTIPKDGREVLLRFKKILRYQFAKDHKDRDLIVFDVGDGCYVFMTPIETLYPVKSALENFKDGLKYVQLPRAEIRDRIASMDNVTKEKKLDIYRTLEVTFAKDHIRFYSDDEEYGNTTGIVKLRRQIDKNTGKVLSFNDIPVGKVSLNPVFFKDALSYDIEVAMVGGAALEFRYAEPAKDGKPEKVIFRHVVALWEGDLEGK